MGNVDDNRTFTISEVSNITGLPIDTLRYYEKIGMIVSPNRGVGKQREYNNEDIGKIQFLIYLKRTNMPLKKIQEYVDFYKDENENKCYEILDEHRQSIEQQIKDLGEVLKILNYKLEHFQEVKDGKTKGEINNEFK